MKIDELFSEQSKSTADTNKTEERKKERGIHGNVEVCVGPSVSGGRSIGLGYGLSTDNTRAVSCVRSREKIETREQRGPEKTKIREFNRLQR